MKKNNSKTLNNPNVKFTFDDVIEVKSPEITRIELALMEKYKPKKKRKSILGVGKKYVVSLIRKVKRYTQSLTKKYDDYKKAKAMAKLKVRYNEAFTSSFKVEADKVVDLIEKINPKNLEVSEFEKTRQNNIKTINSTPKRPAFVDVNAILQHNKTTDKNGPELNDIIKEFNKNPFVK